MAIRLLATFLRGSVPVHSWRRLSSIPPGNPRTTRRKETPGAVEKFIKDKIRVNGPMTVAEYMGLCVSAYYSRANVDADAGKATQTQGASPSSHIFGASGDFITSPELSQLFGEMLGVWCVHELRNSGHGGGAWQLVEVGPGTGQLMNDVLTVLRQVEEREMSVCLVETSDSLIDAQERLLCASTTRTSASHDAHVRHNVTRDGIPISWYRTVDELPPKFARDADGKWHEIYVNLDARDELCFMLSRAENLHTLGFLPQAIRNDASRKAWEMSPIAGTFMNQIAERITKYGGFALTFDYGHDGSRRDLSMRAYRAHELVNPLLSPGDVDITADVNFGHLRSLIEDRCLIYGPVNQRDFLARMGIEIRLRRLIDAASSRETKETLIKGYNMLMSDEGLGTKFKAFAVFPRTLAGILKKRGGAPAGFVTADNQDRPGDK